MKTYIGCKIIQGEPMSRDQFAELQGKPLEAAADITGYRVVYPGGYTSWSPTFPFESSYWEIIPGELELLKDNSTRKES